jgi:hypothetical protein
VQVIEDSSETGIVTAWENTLPFNKISLDDFERRIKKLVDSETGDELNIRQLVESFIDHP